MQRAQGSFPWAADVQQCPLRLPLRRPCLRLTRGLRHAGVTTAAEGRKSGAVHPAALASEYQVAEGSLFIIGLSAIDPERGALRQWGGLIGRLVRRSIRYAMPSSGGPRLWCCRLVRRRHAQRASDGLMTGQSGQFRLVVTPVNAPPTPGAGRVNPSRCRRATPVRLRPQGSRLTAKRFATSAPCCDSTPRSIPATGEFEWTPGFSHAGVYDIVFGVTRMAGNSQVTARFGSDECERRAGIR